MCGGYYEEEFEMRGPMWKFKNAADFEKAVRICKKKVPADSWRVTDDNTITFASMKAEELYAVAKAVDYYSQY